MPATLRSICFNSFCFSTIGQVYLTVFLHFQVKKKFMVHNHLACDCSNFYNNFYLFIYSPSWKHWMTLRFLFHLFSINNCCYCLSSLSVLSLSLSCLYLSLCLSVFLSLSLFHTVRTKIIIPLKFEVYNV